MSIVALAVALATGQAVSSPITVPPPSAEDNARPELIGGEQHMPTSSPLTPLLDMDARAAPRRVFASPQVVRNLATPRNVVLATNALLLEETAYIRPIQLISDRAIPLPKWLGGAVPTDAAFILQVSTAGASACLTKTEEPRTKDGVYVPVCLYDSDDDEVFDHLIVGTDDAIAVDPMRLAVLDPSLPSRVNYPKVEFQLWVREMTPTVVHIECGTDISVGGGQRRYTARFMKVRNPNLCQIDLPLKEGAQMSYLGITLATKRNHGVWRIAISGQANWINLGKGGTLIDAHVMQLEMI